MNKLNPLHYLPVFLKPVPGRVVLYNPVFVDRWSENFEFLERLKLPHTQSPYMNNRYFEELDKNPTRIQDPDVTETLLAFALESVPLPSKLTERDYYQIVQGNYLSVTEKFLSRHVCGHVAATRHVLLKDLQIKGVGRTASTQQLSYPNMNGFIRTSEAVRGYYNATLLQSSLPYGSVKMHAVICVIDDKLHSSIVLRDADSHRLAQIEPVFLDQKDKEKLLQEVQSSYDTTDTKVILRRILEQHICLWLMGVEHPMTVDNLALAGYPMDEEDMRPGSNMHQLTLDFSVKIPSDVEIITSTDELFKQSFEFTGGLNHRLKLLMTWYEECLIWVLDGKVSSLPSEEKLALIEDVLNSFYDNNDVKLFMATFRKLEQKSSFVKEEMLNFIKDLAPLGVTSSISDQQMQCRHSQFRIHANLRMIHDLRGRFNAEPRIPTEKVISRFSRFEMEDYSYNSETAFQNSNQLHRVANRQAFCFSELEVKELPEILESIVAICQGLAPHSVEIFGSNGWKTLNFDEWSAGLRDEKEFILVEVIVVSDGKPFAIPTPKKWYKIR